MLTRSRRIIVITAKQTTAPARRHQSHPCYMMAEGADPASPVLICSPPCPRCVLRWHSTNLKKLPFPTDGVLPGFLRDRVQALLTSGANNPLPPPPPLSHDSIEL